MPRFLKATPKYTATSFEDRMKHLLLYKEEYEKQQDIRDKMLEDTLVLEQLKNSDVDADLYRNYSDWRAKLNESSSNLTDNGQLDMQGILSLRRDYLNNFKPKEDLLKLRNTLVQKQAAEYTPDTIYDRDFSKVSLDDMTMDANYRSLKLSDIEKRAFDELSNKYMVNGLPTNSDSDIEGILSNIDTEGFSESQIDSIRQSINRGYTRATTAVNEYNRQQNAYRRQEELQGIQKETALLQQQKIREELNKPDTTPVLYKQVEGNAGDTIDIYKVFSNGKEHYAIMKDGKPVLIDSMKIKEDGTINYADLYKIAYGEPGTQLYGSSEYRIDSDTSKMARYRPREGTKKSSTKLIHTAKELRDYLAKSGLDGAALSATLKEIYGVKDAFNSNLFNLRDIEISNYTNGTNTIRLIEKSSNTGSFELFKTDSSKDSEEKKSDDKEEKPAGNGGGVGNKTYN